MLRNKLVDYAKTWSAAYWLLTSGLIGGWWLFATRIMPEIISDPDAVGPTAMLRAVFSPHGGSTAARLDAWQQLATSATGYMLAAVLVVYFVIRTARGLRTRMLDAVSV